MNLSYRAALGDYAEVFTLSAVVMVPVGRPPVAQHHHKMAVDLYSQRLTTSSSRTFFIGFTPVL